MKERIVSGGSVMIKIDGSKVKQLRESKGLTQLYIATAVEVTTDTISRWENKRYPTIKQENGLKLAEALEVDLDEILDTGNTSLPATEGPPSLPEQPVVTTPKSTGFQQKSIIFGVITLLLSSTAIGYVFIQSKHLPKISATRIMPQRAIVDQPFPVVIEVQGNPEKPISLILKEKLPLHAGLISMAPKVSSTGSKERSIKWIQKMTGKSVFAYMVTINSDSDSVKDFGFSGSIAVHLEEEEPISVSGPNSIILGKHHWADSDGDNVISDREILTVYDQFSGIDGFDINIDLIERMWLGSQYQWNVDSKSFTILP